MQDWTEAPADCLILALYQLQVYYVNEIKRGMAGQGEYTLADQFSATQLEEVCFNSVVRTSPAEVAKTIKEGLSKTSTDDKDNVLQVC